MRGLFEENPEPAASGWYADVALERGVDTSLTGLTYAIPQGLEKVKVGQRVIVPLGKNNKLTAGYVVRVHRDCRLREVKGIVRVEGEGSWLTEELVELGLWMSRYYCTPIGMVLGTMLPAAVKRGVGNIRQLQVRVAEEGVEEPKKLTKLQRRVWEGIAKLQEEGREWLSLREAADWAGLRTIGPVKKLLEAGLLVAREQTAVRADPLQAAMEAEQEREERLELTEEQKRAVEALYRRIESGGFSVSLIRGVTGSGKTEVYLRAIERAIETGGGAIVLVPEIALTPQTVRRFARRFGSARLAVLHSGLSAAQRHWQWRRIREGEARIVIGARSAVFAPVERLRLIVVDEEHESSYKQAVLPRYHARDVAIKRGQVAGACVILGSATPSLESYYQAIDAEAIPGGEQPGGPVRRYTLLELERRVPGLRVPRVEIVDMREERRRRHRAGGGGGVHLLSMALEEAMGRTLQEKGQVILLLNRRGYANYVSCPDHRCGWVMTCNYCEAAMVYHKDQRLPQGGVLCCHHCQAEQILPGRCPVCGRKATVFGMGTQRIEEEMERKFPGVRLGRMDRDAMRRERDYYQTLQAFAEGQIDVLIGTQMVAKGLDFPNVRLVGVISADTALHLPDFRAAERTFQLVAQVAGRAGRSEKGGLVIVQSWSPNDPAIVLASREDYREFAGRELKLRTEAGLPPVRRMAQIVVRDRKLERCQELAERLKERLDRANAAMGERLRIRGPIPPPIGRLAGYYRRQIVLLGPEAESVQAVLRELREGRLLKSDAQTAVDVDPVSLM